MLTRNCLLLFLWILVDEGSVSYLRPPLPPLGRSRTGREHARSLVGPMRNGAAGFQRVKRGWVWNQFFVLEEYMGSDPQYVEYPASSIILVNVFIFPSCKSI
uniref:Cadherin N-terminal domain-containing protein n=1 Tax=Neolamprologus brichardi TaxID=32507 RepID=A0A3Q4GJC2_NEOBR